MLLTARTSAAQLRLTVPEASPLGKTDTVSVLIGGDVMLHARQLDYGFSGFFRDVGELMRSADFTAVNMEFSLGGPPYSGYPAFSAPDSIACILASGCRGRRVPDREQPYPRPRGRGLGRTLEVYSACATTSARSTRAARPTAWTPPGPTR